jgi:hypothetical protein
VDVVLRADRPELALEIYRRSERPRSLPPQVACFGSCAFKLLPGSYRLHIEGPAGSEVEPTWRAFDLGGPSTVNVSSPSAAARWTGFAMGLIGPLVMITGLAALEYHPNRQTTEQDVFIGGACLVGGVMLTAGGWILFAYNSKPHLEIKPLPPSPAPRGPGP